MSNKKEIARLSPCERIWVGRYKDNLGTFEILVPACDREQAVDRIKTCLGEIKNGEMRVTQKIAGEPDLLYIDEVGKCDYIRN